MPIVSTAMSESLRDRLDQFATDHGYGGRSEVMREACRSLLDAYDTDDGGNGPLVATVTAVFGYDQPDIERQMMELRHDFEQHIRSNAHDCLADNRGCVETFTIEGAHDVVTSFVAKVRAIDESVSVQYTTVPIEEAVTNSSV